MSISKISSGRIRAKPAVTPSTGMGAIAATYAPGVVFWLESVTLHLSGAPVTSEDFTIVLDAADGAAYDTVFVRTDLSVGGVTSLLWQPAGGRLLCEADDAIDVAYTNTDGNTYGLRIVTQLA